MRHDPQKLYEDIVRAADEIQVFCQGKTFDDFRDDRALRRAVEREFEIIGEALARLERALPAVSGQIADADKIVALRNVLAHGYGVLDYEILWDAVVNKVPTLKQNVEQAR